VVSLMFQILYLREENFWYSFDMRQGVLDPFWAGCDSETTAPDGS
jgi:hypothetical protein